MMYPDSSWPRYWAKEIEHLPKALRRELLRAASRETVLDPKAQRLRWIVGGIFFPLIAGGFVLMTISKEWGWIFDWIWTLSLPAMIVWFAMVEPSLNRTAVIRSLRLVMLHRGIRPAYCFGCGYDLRCSRSLECPECGGTLAPPTQEESDGAP